MSRLEVCRRKLNQFPYPGGQETSRHLGGFGLLLYSSAGPPLEPQRPVRFPDPHLMPPEAPI